MNSLRRSLCEVYLAACQQVRTSLADGSFEAERRATMGSRYQAKSTAEMIQLHVALTLYEQAARELLNEPLPNRGGGVVATLLDEGQIQENATPFDECPWMRQLVQDYEPRVPAPEADDEVMPSLFE
jgi:hypothetical protein